jgi:PAS domain-containing protein
MSAGITTVIYLSSRTHLFEPFEVGGVGSDDCDFADPPAISDSACSAGIVVGAGPIDCARQSSYCLGKNMEAQGDSLFEAVPVPKIPARPPGKSGMPVWDAEQLRLAISAAGVALWSWNVDTNRFTMDERAFHLWGVPLSGSVTFDDLSSHIHPADRDRVKAAFAATRAIVGGYEIDFRIMVGEEVRWVSARGQGSDADIVGRIMYGIFLDVTGRKQAEEGHELLAGEMSHRVKNLLAIATGLTAITSRSAKTTAEMAKELTHRLTALGRAHESCPSAPGSGRASW